MENSPRNIKRFLRSLRQDPTGPREELGDLWSMADQMMLYNADRPLLEKHIRSIEPYCYGHHWPHAFDHLEIWGRGGTPYFLIGHPYQLNSAEMKFLASLIAAGVPISIDDHTWYGHGTLHVEASHPTVSVWPREFVKGPDRGDYRLVVGFDPRPILERFRTFNPAFTNERRKAGENSLAELADRN
jgi:hypothetical protein